MRLELKMLSEIAKGKSARDRKKRMQLLIQRKHLLL